MSPLAPPAPAYALPAGTGAGTYIIQAVYNGTTNFLGYTDTSQTLDHQRGGASATAAATASGDLHRRRRRTSPSTPRSPAPPAWSTRGPRPSPSSTATTVIGIAVTVNVSAGAASAAYALPAGTAGGTYIIQAVYNGTTNFLGYTDTSQTLVDQRRGLGDRRRSASATFNAGRSTSPSTPPITSTAGMVNEGTETFTILNGTTIIGVAVTVNVSAGAASAAYALPAGTGAGTYIIQAVYNGTTNFLGYTDTSQDLVINAAATATAAGSLGDLHRRAAGRHPQRHRSPAPPAWSTRGPRHSPSSTARR